MRFLMSAVIELHTAGGPCDQGELWMTVIEAFELNGMTNLTACVVHEGEVVVSATVFAVAC